MSHPCATPQLRSASLQQLQLQQQQQLRRAGCSAARVVAPAARAAGPQRAQGVATTQQLSGLGVRLVAAAIPVRYTSGRTEVCLVTSSKGEGLVLPKGTVEQSDACAASAATREAREEAGVAGTVRNIAGLFSFETRRGKRRGRTHASVYVVDVEEEMPDWQESSVRRRHWLPAQEAFDALKHNWQREALISAGLVDLPAS